jgi:uncharacterized protein DUF6894
MSRYYFHVRRGQITVLDHGGIELADTADAEVEAARRAQGLVNGECEGPQRHPKCYSGPLNTKNAPAAIRAKPARRLRVNEAFKYTTENTTKTTSVITSCMVLSWAGA